MSQWLHRGLTDAGLDAVLMETPQVKGASKAVPIKTDRSNAKGIVHLLHLGWFRPVHCKSISAQEVRGILSNRRAISRTLALEMSLRGLLRNFGWKVGAISRGRFGILLTAMRCARWRQLPCCVQRRRYVRKLASLERLVRQMAQDGPVCVRLMTMPGIGAVIALAY
uniref:hypothetical protein n=1 Tax=Tateyamaria pelophila TaxID=328415 RepID=UPI0029585216|nr:hypothetical protein [Tateyamaria pelophila]